LVRLERHGTVSLIIIDSPPVNAGSRGVRQGLVDAVTAADADAATTAVVLMGAGSNFMAGSDIKEFDLPIQDPDLPAVIAAFERCTKPVVAAIDGAALGGGLELAMGCDYRLATGAAKLGLPETTLGIIPGAGGTQRLPRLVGRPLAMKLMASGEAIGADRAVGAGLIDRRVDGSLLTAALDFAQQPGLQKRIVALLAVPDASSEELAAAVAEVRKAGRGRPCIEAVIAAVETAGHTPVAAALAADRATFQALRVAEEAAALRYQFFAERAARRPASLEGIVAPAVRSVGVVGAGTMGAGIAVTLAAAGLAVTVIDTTDAALERGRELVGKALGDLERRGGKPAAAVLETMTFTTELAALGTADLVIEAVFEDRAVKTELLGRLDAILRPDAIIATNTSYLDIEELARASGRAERLIGLHFFAPAHRMRLVEVVRCSRTRPDVLLAGVELARAARKLPVLTGPAEGFIGNRIYNRYRTQCEFLIEDGATIEAVDAAMVAFGFAMGPFAVGDLSGLDIAWRNRQRTAAKRDPGARYSAILDELCENGRLGRKANAGWYDYRDGAAQRSEAAEAIIARHVRPDRRTFSAAEIQRRVLGAILNEAALVLADGTAQSAGDIDAVLVNGYGFSKFRGGPIFLARRMPRDEVHAAVAEAVAASGPRFAAGDVDRLLDAGPAAPQ
jgi:3-hydroxyacyl-CoA dehydrogenase